MFGLGLALDLAPSVAGGGRPALSLEFTGGALDPRITFTRGSQATMFDRNGLLVYAPHNLLLRSNEFANATWTKANGTITDLGNGSFKFTPAAASGTYKSIQQAATAPGGVRATASIEVKPDGYNFAHITISGSNGRAKFDLVNELSDTSGATNGVTSSTSLADGWKRITFTVDMVGGSGTSWFGSMTTYNFPTVAETADGVSGILMRNAQMEISSTARTYIPTTSAAVYSPRFDHDPVTLQPLGLLIEEARTNLLTYSQDFSNAVWLTANSATLTANAAVAPDGSTTAARFTNGGVSGGSIRQLFTATAVQHTFSIWLKADTVGTAQLSIYEGVAHYPATATIVSGPGAITGTGLMSVTGLSTTQWTRVAITSTGALVASSTNRIFVYPETSAAGTGKSIFVWGAQVEAGAFATSYIPTTTAAATRAAETCDMTGANFSSWYNQAEGAFAVDYDYTPGSAVSENNRGPFILDDTTANERMMLYNGPSSAAYVVVTDDTVLQASLNSGEPHSTSGALIKAALAYKVNDFALSAQGRVAVTDAAGTLPTVTRLAIGRRGGSTFINGHIKRIRYWPTRLPNSQLQAITA